MFWRVSEIFLADKQTKSLCDLFSHPAEGFDLLIRRRFGGIVKTPMNGLCSWKGRTLLLGAIADGDHVIEFPAEKLLDVLGRVAADINADFFQDLDGARVN